jgi:riboflavin synthase alpha subunit
MLERRISVDDIKGTISKPDNKEEVYGDRIKVEKDLGGKLITVVYFKDKFRDKKNQYIIITAYYS